jgi:hypothetical protein
MLDKEPEQLRHVPLYDASCSGVDPLPVLGCRDRAVLDKEPCNFDVSPVRRLMQWSRPALVLGCRDRAVLDKEPCNLDVSPDDASMQWSRPAQSWAVTTAPCSIRSRATSTFPLYDAQCSGVDPPSPALS